MSKFNSNFYQPNRNYTVEMAQNRLIEKGFENFTFNNCSFSNGASFYFTLDNGQKVRVSDHPLTGNRAFDYVQIDIVEIKVLPSALTIRKNYLAGEITKKEYRAICKELGFIYRP